MPRIRKALVLAATINTTIFIGEAFGGVKGHSSSLIMDAVHNFSDELALVCLCLAYYLPVRMSKNFQRIANVLNSIGLIAISALVIWQSVERVIHPAKTAGYIAIITGVLAAFANWGVARILLPIKEQNAAIRLAYLHNLGDVYVSLAPIAAGLLIIATGKVFFDPVIAIAIGLWLIITTIKEIRHSYNELIWPEDVVSKDDESQKKQAV